MVLQRRTQGVHVPKGCGNHADFRGSMKLSLTDGLSRYGFASDNNSGVLPEVMEAIREVNSAHLPSYGDDFITRACEAKFKEHFGPASEVFFVFNGTAANVLALSTLVRPFESVFCAKTSHVENDECGAPERFLGSKLRPLEAPFGKLTVGELEKNWIRKGDQHYSQIKAITLTQPTELGTVYTLEEIRSITSFAKRNKLYVHMDGARFANACASLKVSFAEMVCSTGVDILSFGGTKNGLMAAEAIVILNPALAPMFRFIRKQGMQLASKMRFLSAQFLAYLEGDLWKKTALHSLEMAQLLKAGAEKLNGVTISYPVESNAVFARIPREIVSPLRDEFFFYVWDETTFECRWMTTFDTSPKIVNEFLSCAQELIERGRR